MSKASQIVIAWTPAYWRGCDNTVGKVILAPRPPRDTIKEYAFWAYATGRDQSGAEALAQLFIQFHTLIVRDGIDPAVAHEAFLGIDEYAAAISPDIKGAQHG